MTAIVDLMKTNEYMVSTPAARRGAVYAMNHYLNHVKSHIDQIVDIVQVSDAEHEAFWKIRNENAVKIGVTALRCALTVAAKIALEEYIPLAVRNHGTSKLLKFFRREGFQNVPSEELMKKMDESMTIPYSRNTQYRCEEGTDIMIDWEKRAFVFSSWSSDD